MPTPTQCTAAPSKNPNQCNRYPVHKVKEAEERLCSLGLSGLVTTVQVAGLSGLSLHLIPIQMAAARALDLQSSPHVCPTQKPSALGAAENL